MSMKVYALHTFAHYGDHLQPIVDALRDDLIDVDVLSTSRKSIFGEYVHVSKLDPRGLWIVAGSVDAARMGDRPYVYVEHGAGQTYEADERGLDHASYSTGKLPGNPRLDHLHAHASGMHEGVQRDVVAFAWHWNCQLVPETQTAWDHYRPKLLKVVLALHRRGYRCVAHAHPRIAKQIRYHSERMGMEWWDVEDVLTMAHVLAFDNTSLGYEFASLDRPTVVMNAPWYRRHVHHGLRFWECIPGELVDEPEQLVDAIDLQMHDDDESLRSCVDAVVPLRDGLAARRAAVAIGEVLGSLG
jgi:hypothetical protein